MPRCPRCKRHFRTLEDEQDIHDCPYCGYFPRDEERDALDDLDRDGGALEDASPEDFERWADAYDDLNGAPESEEDR